MIMARPVMITNEQKVIDITLNIFIFFFDNFFNKININGIIGIKK